MDKIILTRATARRIVDLMSEKSEDIDENSELAKAVDAIGAAFDTAQGDAGNDEDSIVDIDLDIGVRGGAMESEAPVNTKAV